MNEKWPVQFAAATGDVHAAFDLQRLPARDFVVQKLIRMRIRSGAAHAAADIDFDSDGGVRPAVAFDIGHDQIGAVFGGGSGDVVVGEVGAVLEQHVPREGMHLVEIVVGAARQSLLFRRFVHAHVHADIVGGAHLAAEYGNNFALHRGS